MSNVYPVFIVICADDCCQDCANTYLGKVFSTEKDLNMNPPLHKDCKCATAYFETEELDKRAAKIIEETRKNNQNATQKND
jgi:hypothetical protein